MSPLTSACLRPCRHPKTSGQLPAQTGLNHAQPAAAAAAGWSVPQYRHLLAAAGRSSDRHAGQVLTGGGAPNTVTPRRAEILLYGTTITKYTTAMKTTK